MRDWNAIPHALLRQRGKDVQRNFYHRCEQAAHEYHVISLLELGCSRMARTAAAIFWSNGNLAVGIDKVALL